MSLRLYDTQAQAIRDFVPLVPGAVGIYLCGATVQAGPHIGHLRPAVAFDILRRWLERCGYNVTLVRNVTDIDDKILAKAARAGVPWWAHALRCEREFTAAYDALGVVPPTYEPRATGHVTDMIDLIDRLIERGHAYTAGSGNVYFDVRSYADYGSLTHQQLDGLVPTEEDLADSAKRDPRDFALWKAPKSAEPATAAWPTPWGRGRPGWHLECSAMSRRYLGDSFDIHAGGMDLRFPHHENEQAQSRAAGLGFVRYWLHNGWVTQAGVKMSKSLGNTLSAAALLAQAPAIVLRYALGAGHYRSQIEFGKDSLAEATAAWERIAGFVTRAGERFGQPQAEAVRARVLPVAFGEALDSDLGVPAALAAVHEAVRRGNSALAEGDSDAGEALCDVRAMLDVLGLDPLSDHWSQARGDDSRAHEVLGVLIDGELQRRAQARAARDYAAADDIRDGLVAAGVAIEDSPTGARWSLT
jgi:cysteinyl-tRNA synthetase